MHSGHPRFCEPVRLFDRERKIVDVRVCKLFFAKHRGREGRFPFPKSLTSSLGISRATTGPLGGDGEQLRTSQCLSTSRVCRG